MNIIFDSQHTAPNVTGTDNYTTTYKATAATESKFNSGYSLDIADKVMDDKAYQGHGLTAEDIMQQAQDTNAQVQKDFMIVMSNSVSGEDLQKMEEEGFQAGSTDVETYVSIVDQIKVTLAKAGVTVAGYNDDIDAAVIEEITGSKIDANQLIKKMEEADLPVTEETMQEIGEAAAQAQELTSLSEDALKYMILNHKSPTIENTYLAQFSSAANLKQAKGYYSDGGYYAKKADSINWDNLQCQIEKTIKRAGLSPTQETIDQAKWLVESGIELTTQNLTALSDLSGIQLPMSVEDTFDLAIAALGNGKAPKNALLTGEENIHDQAALLVEEVSSISDEAIHQVVEKGEIVNLKNLNSAQKEIAEQQNKGEKEAYEILEKNSDRSLQDVSDSQNSGAQNVGGQIKEQSEMEQMSLRELEAKRQLEEIRLMMTEEANLKLLKSGFSIDTTELSQLVEALKATENARKTAMFQGETAEENEIMAKLYEDTLTTTKELAYMPAAVLGKTISFVETGKPFTLGYLHEEGTILQKQYQAAGETYEALMTAPRKDLGDNIQKAFANVDDLLAELGMENNESNRRAVRILGYNSMEITKDNMEAVKEADKLVTGVMRRMTPATTLQMIRNQVNPLEMDMQELDEYLYTQDKELGKDAEKFSKYLQKLDRSGNISEEEREAYIGIYRMFRQIEKSDGAVIGNLVATGAQINFKNVLSAIRTNADKNMDIRIDKEYGCLEQLIAKGTAIDTQIQTGFGEQQAGSDGQTKDTQRDLSQEKYYARLSGEVKEELATKTTVEQLQQISVREDTTLEQFADNLGLYDTSSQKNQQQIVQQREELREFQQSVKAAQEIEESVIQTLIDYEQPVSIDNIEAASMLIMERGSLYKQIFGRAQVDTTGEKTVETEQMSSDMEPETEELWQAADKAIEGLTDEVKAKETYQELVTQASKIVENMIYEQGASLVDVKAARALYKGLNLAGNLAREENYEFPVNVKGEITSVNLKIYHNSAKAGKVAVTFATETLGKVAAEFDVSKERISGMVAFEQKQYQEDLEGLKSAFEQELGSMGRVESTEKKIQISLANAPNLDLNKFGQDREIPEETEKLSTKELYQTAKAFMTALKELSNQKEMITQERSA